MLTIALVLLLLSKESLSLKFLKLGVPGAVQNGDPIWLHCDFDLEGDPLYSVKWYKNNVEFYRYLPSKKPPGRKYNLLGVYMDLSQSNESYVYLYRTDLNTEGTYACEVSTEAPLFKTVKAEEDLRVYVMPKELPTIDGIVSRYQVGDVLNVTCTSIPSKPVSTLKWLVDDQEVNPNFETRYPILRHPDGLQSSRIRLTLVLDHRHFRRGVMKLHCKASLALIYSSSSEELVIRERGSRKPVQNVIPVFASQKKPTIKGGLPKYEVGDSVDINCTTNYSNLAVLNWYINDNQVKPEYIMEYSLPDGSPYAVLGLRFRVQQLHFRTDELRLKCTATLLKVINMITEKKILLGYQQISGLHADDTESVQNGGISRLLHCWTMLLVIINFR
ncbi:synaptogenesis protein syg-2-like [Centruroides vittatus]|uniref:synaptogenesis protein syg-2-like n=1 Tax=Centruroides vittatus TaxID=120091 RepID=UPI0035104C96